VEYLGTQTLPIAGLARWPGNPRRGDVEAIRASVRTFGGQYRSIVVRMADGSPPVIVAGNHTTMALEAEGFTGVRSDLIECTDGEARKINAADNRLAELGGYDDGELITQLTEIAADGGDFEGTGWGEADLARMLARQPSRSGKSDPDGLQPPPPAEPRTQPGDIWQLGRHRLVCGDCTNPVAAGAAGGGHAGLILTDPPYCSGGFQESGRGAGSVGRQDSKTLRRAYRQIANDRLSTRGYQALIRQALATATGARFAYVFTDWRMWVNLFDVVESSGFGVRGMVVWDKGSPGLGRGWCGQHELVMWAGKDAAPSPADGGTPVATSGNVRQHSRTGNELHTTQKPVGLCEDLLHVAWWARDVYDPFTGAGTTLIAAERQDRTFGGCELDPGYCDVTIARWEEFTGQDAGLAGRLDEVAVP
jgi:DNA modification methylase